MSLYVLIHGNWHDGSAWAKVIKRLEHQGHTAFGPTLSGHGKAVPRQVSHAQCTQSVVDFLVDKDLTDIVLVGHSYGGTIISKVVEALTDRVRRLVFLSGVVLEDGERLMDADQLRQAAPDGIDVYFDNVGAEHLEAAISVLTVHGRAVLCGMISQYNDAEPPSAPRNLVVAINKRLRLEGMLARDHADLRDQFVEQASEWIRAGTLKYRETILDGIERAADAIIDMLRGKNTGKMLVRLQYLS